MSAVQRVLLLVLLGVIKCALTAEAHHAHLFRTALAASTIVASQTSNLPVSSLADRRVGSLGATAGRITHPPTHPHANSHVRTHQHRARAHRNAQRLASSIEAVDNSHGACAHANGPHTTRTEPGCWICLQYIRAWGGMQIDARAGCACCGIPDVLPFQSAQDDAESQALVAAMLNTACAECILASSGDSSAMLACAADEAKDLVASLSRGNNTGTDPLVHPQRLSLLPPGRCTD
jgi:hypothetical protein